MARIPRYLLRHRVTVFAYVGWDTYAGADLLRCLVDEKLSDRFTQAGTQLRHSVMIYADRDAVCPAGSRVILPDGRVGYASASVRHDGGGLPTPDHLEVAVDLASAIGPPAGETVVLLRRVVAGRDAHGSDRYSTTEVVITGCAVRPLSSTESTAGRQDRVTDSLEVILPPGTAVTSLDRLRVRGLTYSVDGTPESVRDPATGAEPGVRVIARRVTG